MDKDSPEFAAFNMGDMKKYMEQMQFQPFDMSAFIDMGRKNAQTLATIQQLSLEAWQEMIAASQKIVQELASEQTELATSVMTDGAPEEKIARAADRMRQSYEKAHKSYKDLTDIQHKLSQDMSDLVSRRIKANLNDLKDVAGK